jgi:hypothetical protein
MRHSRSARTGRPDLREMGAPQCVSRVLDTLAHGLRSYRITAEASFQIAAQRLSDRSKIWIKDAPRSSCRSRRRFPSDRTAVFERLPNSGAPTEFCCSPAPLLWRCDVERMRIDNEVLRPGDRRLSSTLIRCNPLLGATLGLGAPITIVRLSEPGATALQRDRP